MAKQRSVNQSTISKAFQSLPLFEDLFLRMQAQNLDILDAFLMDAEQQLLVEYTKIERTPLNTATFVSALNQLWIFGVYELLRTWRQRARSILKFVDAIIPLNAVERWHVGTLHVDKNVEG